MAIATALKNWGMTTSDGVVLEPSDRSDKDADERFARQGGLRVHADKSGYHATTEPMTDRSCVRCAHYRHGEMDAAGTHRCERPQLGVTHDYVVGADVPNTRDAYAERRLDEGACGPEGKFWQQSGF
jgi:hypothetical protein